MNAGSLSPSESGSITDVPGIEVGNAQDDAALTGCTVLICRKGAVAGVDVRGSAPGTRETDLLDPINLVEKIHAVLLAGGSAFGLDAASGVMRYLEEQKIGFNTGVVKVPIVPAAILFDLAIGNKRIRPNAEMGYKACQAASKSPPNEGNTGAGTGASVGKMFGMALAMKSGLGSTSFRSGSLVIGAIVAVNAFGDIIDRENGEIVAGLRSGKAGPLKVGGKDYFANTLTMLKKPFGRAILGFASRTNTVIGAVATNARLSKAEAKKVAQMAHDGLARAVQPAHTMLDGDTLFALSTGNQRADVSVIGAFAAEVMTQAILRAVKMAAPAGGIPGLKK